MGGFKVRLVAYFLLLALVPLGAAFWAFGGVLARSESRRVDARLQAELRAALTGYHDVLAATEREAKRLASDPGFQRALRARDAAALQVAVASVPNLVVRAGGKRYGTVHPRAAERRVAVTERGRHLGEVTIAVPFDDRLLARLRGRAGLDRRDTLLLLGARRVVAGPGPLVGEEVETAGGRAGVVELGGTDYRVLAGPVSEPPRAAVALVFPQAKIDAATRDGLERLLLALAAALALTGIVAYLFSRSIVRTLSEFARAANAIARGKLSERVPAEGRDEFAKLAHAFNDMASQLEARVDELEAERRRLRESTLRFGEALAATHDVRQLRRVIVETTAEATGAASALLLSNGEDVVEVGSPVEGGERLELPLLAGRTSLGTLVLTAESFDAEEREAAVLLAGQAVVALENARLHGIVERQAQQDGLTGLANRRRLEELLAVELARAARLDAPVALILADLDRFKEVNDRYGHPAGDAVLCEFAARVRENVREIDHAGRWGGEEFAIILPGTDTAGAEHLAERLRAALEGRTIVASEDNEIAVTASFGVASYPEQGTLENLVSAADSALYQAKRSGRNRVSAAGAEALRP